MSTVTAVPLRPVRGRILVYLGLGIALAVIAAVILAWQAPRDATTVFLAHNRSQPGVVETPSGLQYRVLQPGSGPSPTDADVVLVNYVGKLTNGTVFDQSPQPSPFPVAGVVPGFSEALKLMNRGAKYRIWVKPSLGYGDKPAGTIPAHSVLTFDLDLIDFRSQAELQQMQLQQQMLQQGAPGAPPAGTGAAPGR